MIQENLFVEGLRKHQDAFAPTGIRFRKEATGILYGYFKQREFIDFQVAMENLKENPPKVLNYVALRDAMNAAQRNRESDETGRSTNSHWNGTECDCCDQGLIHTIEIQLGGLRYPYTWLCPVCRSSNLKGLGYYPKELLGYRNDDKEYPNVLKPDSLGVNTKAEKAELSFTRVSDAAKI